MSQPQLLVDGRVLDDDHPGVRRFWVPVLRAWAEVGGRGLLAHRRGRDPEPALLAVGFSPLELEGSPRNPLSCGASRRAVRATGVRATLSPLYLTLDGAPRNLATVFDLTGRKHPRNARSRWLWEIVARRTCRRASAVIAPSGVMARELEAVFPALRDRVSIVSAVAPPPPSLEASLLEPLRLARPFALAVASNRPHKRLGGLARAWRRGGPRPPLVLAGAGTELLAAPPSVLGLGFVSDAKLESLLAAAGCLVSASLAEGFGLPVLAALAAGVPVVASRLPALEEVAGEAALWFEPRNLDGLAVAASAVARDPSRATDWVARGRARAAEYTAARASAELIRVLKG